MQLIYRKTESKGNWVMDAFAKSNHEQYPHTVMWGNISTVRSCPKPFLFTDMPYFNRWMGNNRDTCHWRVIPDHVHVTPELYGKYPDDRFNQLNVTVRDWRTNGNHILVCPSSPAIERYYGDINWLAVTLQLLKQHTDRPIRVRHKPRANGTSGPRGAVIPFEEDCKNAWAVVTLASIAAVEAACLGIPVFTHEKGLGGVLANKDLAKIEEPLMADSARTLWLNTLAYYQYTEAEIAAGLYKEIL
jgi:hypothetical protein